MKRLFVALSLLLTVSATTAFASGSVTVTDQVLASFKKEFPGAELIEWVQTGDYYKATFVLAEHRTVAYFTSDGDLQGSARSIFYSQLPLVVMTAIDKRYTDAEVLDVNELNNSNGTFYQVSLEVKNKKYRVKTDSAGNIIETVHEKN